MATVHLARQVGAAGFARIVAIKRLHERFAKDPDFVGMFLDEARIVARIRHPNVVQTVDVVTEDGELFLVMEYVHGESLLRLLQMARRRAPTRDGVLPVSVAASIVVGALHGLHEAHEARGEAGEPLGIVHRDVSPHNILLGVDGVARVLDFGVAKASQRVQSTLEGQLKGKLSYMAPEQLRSGCVDRRTDVYAMAVVLWEALTGAKLFHGENEAAVLTGIMLEPVSPPSRLNGDVPAPLDEIVMRGLSRDPNARFPTARDMALALERSTPLASPSDVAAFVTATCAETIAARGALIAEIEAESSSSNLRQAFDSLRSLTAGPAGRAADGAAPGAAPDVEHRAVVASFPPAVGAALSGPPPSVSSLHAHAREIVAIVTSAVLIVLALAGGGYLFIAKARSSASRASGPDASLSATAAALRSETVSPSVTAVAASCPGGMVFIPGGRFFMGSDDDLPAERPAHKVVLRGFCMDQHETTADAYRACSNRGDCKRAGQTNRWEGITAKESKTYDPLCTIGVEARGNHPINCVDWSMADRYCKAEGKRLPTEAEWEYAARGSDGRKYPWGDEPPTAKRLNACGGECVTWGLKHGTALDALFAESDPWPTTAPVGSFPLGASRWGVEDVAGNVWEWVADWYGTYGAADEENPTGPGVGETRAMRGGAWNGAHTDWVRPTFRFHGDPEMRSYGVGFRCAKSL